MNIFNLLSQEKKVAGIEISDSVVRIAFLQKKDKASTSHDHELVLVEEAIAPNIIENGIVTDPELLSKTLREIWGRARLDTNYAIVAIPDDAIYSRTFSFPRSIDGARLTEAMRLAIAFQLPMKVEEAYLDWERTLGTRASHEILLSAIPRTVAQGYMYALEQAGIKTLALESHLASIARALKTEIDKPILVTEKSPDGITVFILKNGILRFSRTLPTRFVAEDKRDEEIRRIKTAYEAEHNETVIVRERGDLEVNDAYASYPLPDPRPKWIIAIGAVMRAQIPEGEDNLISLLPVGTEEAYAYQKATTFVVFMRNLIVGVSVFFVIAFLSVYLFIYSLSQNATRAITTLSSSVATGNTSSKEAWAGSVNTLIDTTRSILGQTPLWSVVLGQVNAVLIPGISITNWNAPSLSGSMTLTGAAKNRATLNQFKKQFSEASAFADVLIPETNLEQRENIPFSATFRIKDPNTLYYK